MRSLWGRLAGFAGLPVISMITPLLVLPVLGRAAGQAGWASVATGESVGTFAAIVIAYGWNTAGPPRVALDTDPVARARLYRESLLVRGAIAVASVPVIVLLCLLLAADGYGLPTVLMGLSGAVTGLSFSWFAVGAGDPRSIAVYEAVPRVVAAAVSAMVILATHELAFYPVLALSVSLGGIVLFSRGVLRQGGPAHVGVRDLGRLLLRDRAVAAIDIAGGAYATVPVPMVSALTPAAAASSYASADKLYKFGQYVPISLGNAFQSWTVEGHVSERGRRLRVALSAHVLLGLVGWVFLTAVGPWFSGVMFGADVAASRSMCFWLGATFLLVSTRISMTRHILIPVGAVRVVFVSTVAGAVVGVPLIAALVWAIGPVGAPVGLMVSEVVATGILAGPALRRLRGWSVAPAEPADRPAPEEDPA